MIHHLQYRENVHFLIPPLILRLYTGCRLGQTLSKCIASFKKVEVLKLKDTIFIFPMTNVTILGVFRTHAQKEYG